MLRERLGQLGYQLPTASKPAANYLPYQRHGNLLFISGQLPVKPEGGFITGMLGRDMTIEQGAEAARLCTLQLLAQLDAALEGDDAKLLGCIRLGGFVQATADFTQHPAVMNGASDLVVQVLGAQGKHSRTAVGVASLPFGVAVEIEALFAVK